MINKEAITLLSCHKTSCNGCEFNHELGCELNKNCYEAVDMAIEALEQNQWISVDDQLPKITRKGKWSRESDHVICAIRAETLSGTRYIVKEGCYAESGYWRVPGSQCDVVAWMPMPKYEEEN